MANSPEQLQQAVQQAVATAAQQWQEAGAQMHLGIGTLRTRVQDAQAAALPRDATTGLVDTRLRGKQESFDGGPGWKDWSVVFRSHACACSAPLGLLLERTDWTGSIVLDTAVPHAGDAVQRDCSDTSGECWRTGGPGGMESLFPASRTDLADTQ